MASFDFIYVAAHKGQEHELLEALKPRVARFYGDYVLGTRRGSGWVHLHLDGNQFERHLDFGELLELCQKHPDQMPPAEAELSRELSRVLGVDVVRVNAVTSVSALEFTRCRNGEIVRHFQYSPQDERFKDGWEEETGSPEPWEGPHTGAAYITAGDIGRALGLPGLDNAYMPGEGSGPFDLEATVVGQRMAVPAIINEAALVENDLLRSGRAVLLAILGFVALAAWLMYRRWRVPSGD